MWGLTAEPVYSKKVLLMDFSDGRVVSHFLFYFVALCPRVSLSFFPPSSVNACFPFSVFCHRYACFLCFHVGSLILFSECVLACMPHVALVWTLLKFFSCFWFPDFVIWTSPFRSLKLTFCYVFLPASVSFICKPTECWLWRRWHTFRTFYCLILN